MSSGDSLAEGANLARGTGRALNNVCDNIRYYLLVSRNGICVVILPRDVMVGQDWLVGQGDRICAVGGVIGLRYSCLGTETNNSVGIQNIIEAPVS